VWAIAEGRRAAHAADAYLTLDALLSSSGTAIA